MRVILAGYNVDSQVLQEHPEFGEREDITPETISAAYARISRYADPVDELRRRAREAVKKARRSNQRIIFEMGHHSIAEHAVFNFDIIGITRLAIEELESFRLCSFTEKSQRYITIGEDFHLPPELDGHPQARLVNLHVKKLFTTYESFFKVLREVPKSDRLNNTRQMKKKQKGADLKANEDARYVLPLCTTGQLGMTVNARNLELLIRRFSASHMQELRELGKKLYQVTHAIAPSILLFTESCPYDEKVYAFIGDFAKQILTSDRNSPPQDAVTLLEVTPAADSLLFASLLFKVSTASWEDCQKAVKGLDAEQKKELMRRAFSNMELYDAVVREFEFVDTHWQLVVSASCYAQLKRHRMATLSVQQYDPSLGVTVPPSFKARGLAAELEALAEDSQNIFSKLHDLHPMLAAVVLTNAHRRRVHLKMNARELYHFCRLREDSHAQWDIRTIAHSMNEKVKKIMPYTTMLLCGKDQYATQFMELFGYPPKVCESA